MNSTLKLIDWHVDHVSRLLGAIHGSDKHKDGKRVVTTPVDSLFSLDGKSFVRTNSGSTYEVENIPSQIEILKLQLKERLK